MTTTRTDPAAPPGDNLALSAQGLRCVYGDYVAVDGIDLSVAHGELFALLGTNGAGKTTTIETLEGHRKADAGRIRVLGKDPYRRRRTLAGDVAMILQESGFATDLTVGETLRMWRRLHPGRPGPADPLAVVELRHRVDVRVGQLSGGERRRLDLAMAIATRPTLLFADEPTTGLDPESRERTWDVLRNLRAEGCAIVLTTHYLEEAESLAHRLAIMDAGRIAVSGTLDAIVAAHTAKIHCDLPDSTPVPPRLSGESELDGRRLTVRTTALQADLSALLAWADTHHITLGRLSASEASLREVFAAIQQSAASGPAPETRTP